MKYPVREQEKASLYFILKKAVTAESSTGNKVLSTYQHRLFPFPQPWKSGTWVSLETARIHLNWLNIPLLIGSHQIASFEVAISL